MKNNNIKIAIVESGNFYYNIVGKQILELSGRNNLSDLSWMIKSFDNPKELIDDIKSTYQIIIFDNYLKNNNRVSDDNLKELIEDLKIKNQDCLFILLSGFREMVITAEILSEGDVKMQYTKQSNLKGERFEESCSVPSVFKLIDRFLRTLYEPLESLKLQISA